ncbi:MAG: EutN/CcmL family microcompartment protein [Firmicutes bacterium]|nr:EutN/CcmL family microcompartment protein [Bacillota bacterium]
MQIARVIGMVTSTVKVPDLKGVTLLVIQPVNTLYESLGTPIVAADRFGAGVGEYVFYSTSKEGAMNLPIPTACADAGIAGIIDSIAIVKES